MKCRTPSFSAYLALEIKITEAELEGFSGSHLLIRQTTIRPHCQRFEELTGRYEETSDRRVHMGGLSGRAKETFSVSKCFHGIQRQDLGLTGILRDRRTPQ